MARKSLSGTARVLAIQESDRGPIWVRGSFDGCDINVSCSTVSGLESAVRDYLEAHLNAPASSVNVKTKSIRLSKGSQGALKRWYRATDAAWKAQAAEREAQSGAVRTLADEGLAMRDIAQIVDLSHQRVHQILTQSQNKQSTRSSA